MERGTRPPKVFRGSKRRVRRIRMRGNTPRGLFWLAIASVAAFFAAVARLLVGTIAEP